MKKLFLLALILMLYPGIHVFSEELYGYIKAFEVDETTYDRIIFIAQNKPTRDGNGNFITSISQLRAGSYGGDIFNLLVTACSNDWGVKLNVPSLTENANITYLKTPYPMCAVPVNGLVAEYLLNGNAADTSGKGNNGTLYGAIKSATGKFNVPDSAYEFDGVDDYIEIPDSPVLRPGNGSWSVAIWFKAENRDQIGVMLAKRQDASPFELYGFGISTNSHTALAGKTLSFAYIESAGTSERAGVTTNAVIDGSWHHVVYVFDNQINSVQIYVDNKPVPVTLQYNYGSRPVIDNPDPLRIGCNGSQTPAYRHHFKGLIENIRIYNLALTKNEVGALYNETGDNF